MGQGIHQVKVVSAEAAQDNKGFERVAFFDEDGVPVDLAGLVARVEALENPA